MSSNYPELTFTDNEGFDADRLNMAMQVLDQRLRSLEPFTPSWESAVNELRTFGLARLNDAIVPTLERVQQLAQIGFLIADSSTPMTLVQDENVTFVINEGVKRDLFIPTPFLVATRDANATDYATLRTISYDADTGALLATVKTIAGNPGPFNDWWIGPLAGNALASQNYFAQIQAAKDAVLAAKAIVIANSAQASSDLSSSIANLAAINAARDAALAAAANAALWDPSSYSTTSQMSTAITNAITAIVNGAPGALDTLKEVSDYLQKLLVVDVPVFYSPEVQAQAQQNIGLIRALASEISSNTNDNVLTTQKAWDASKFVPLGNLTGAVTINANNGSRFWGTLTGNVIITVTNLKDGQPLDLIFKQDATGSRTVSWVGMSFPDNLASTISLAANSVAVICSALGTPLGFIEAVGWKVN